MIPGSQLAEALMGEGADGVLAFDRRLRLTAWNPALHRLWGLPASAALGRRATALLPFLKTLGDERAMRAALRGERVALEDRPFTTRVPARRGWYQARYAPLHDSLGQVIGGVGVIVDVTPRRAREDSLRLMVELEDAAERAGPADGALLVACLARIGRLKSFRFGAVWLPSETGVLLCRPGSFHGAGLPALRRAALARGPQRREGAAGRAWARGGPVWVEDLRAEPDYPLRAAALKAGLLSAFAVPVFRLGRLCAVLELFDTETRPPEPGFVSWSWSLTRRLSSLVERQRLDRGIAELEHREREAVGQDLNDSLGQLLSGAAMLARGLASDLTRGGSRTGAKAEELAGLLSTASAHVRRLGSRLSPSARDDEGAASALRRLAQEMEAAFKVDCRFETAGRPAPVSPEVTLHLVRIAEEAVLNAVKHGAARRVFLRLSFRPRLDLTVRNDGLTPRFGLAPRGLGLAMMERRARAIGARLRVTGARPRGAVLRCTVTAAGAAA